jgi:D-threo-aldose 1-dehydrogenase
VIATKAGRLLQQLPDGAVDAHFDFSYDAARQSLESSLGRLDVDRVDIVHIHDPDDHIEEALAGTYRALVSLRDEGVIRAVSLGTNLVDTAKVFLQRADLDCMMVAGRYTLLDQGADEVIRTCREREIAFLAAGVFNSGVLARPVDGSWYDYAPVPAETLDRTRRIAAVCESHGVPLRTAALRFPLRNPGVAAIVAGMAAPGEVDENLAALSVELPADLWHELEAEKLVIAVDQNPKGQQ